MECERVAMPERSPWQAFTKAATKRLPQAYSSKPALLAISRPPADDASSTTKSVSSERPRKSLSEQQSHGPAVANRPRLSMSERPRKSFSAAAAAAAVVEARKSFSASVDLTKIVPKQQQQQKLQQQGIAARVENSTEKESAVDARGQDQERSPASSLPKQLLMPVLPVATVDAIMSASDVRSDNANLGPYLVKLAKSFAAGKNPAKALEYGKKAVSFYEKYMDADGNTCLDQNRA